jgi:hypothetical protein
LKKQDELLLQLESIVKELKAGQDEAATTVAMGHKSKMPSLSSVLLRYFFKVWGLKIILVTIIFALLIAGSLWYFSGSTFTQRETAFVEQVQELSTLATAEAHLKVIIEQQDNKIFGKDITVNFPGTKRELLLVVPATVIAGVDLKNITSDSLQVNEKNKEISLALPRATFIQEPAIQMDKVRTFSDEGLFRGEVNWSEGFDLAAEAQELIKQEALEIGLLQTAENSAEKALKEFFSTLGYTVTVNYK